MTDIKDIKTEKACITWMRYTLNVVRGCNTFVGDDDEAQSFFPIPKTLKMIARGIVAHPRRIAQKILLK